jgi:N-acetyl-anhydromuramyl-L-alanine amidase AmpD
LLRLFLLGTQIVIAGRPVEVGRKVVLWTDPGGLNGYAESCVSPRDAASPCCQTRFRRFSDRAGLGERNAAALRETVRQIVLHLDGCTGSRACFASMHDQPRKDGGCGLSAHFFIDADGTIYQSLDLLERAWHAETVNSRSVGIELSNRGDAELDPPGRLGRDYADRPVRELTLNGHHVRAFEFRREQYDALIALVGALLRALPGIPARIPLANGQPLADALAEPEAFSGIVGHLHVDRERQKWDPGALDWRRLLRGLNGPVWPVAPRHPRAGDPVRAPVRGRIVAARDGKRSFALLTHPDGFYLWFEGVAFAAGDLPSESRDALARGQLARLDRQVEPGEVIGRVTRPASGFHIELIAQTPLSTHARRRRLSARAAYALGRQIGFDLGRTVYLYDAGAVLQELDPVAPAHKLAQDAAGRRYQ